MKKFIVSFILLLISFFGFSQQTAIVVNGWNAYVHLPADYSTTTKTFPTIIFFPGDGEVGSNASLVIANGPGAYITQGWNGNITTANGTTVEFIVISLQPPASWPVEVTMNKCFQSLYTTYRIDQKNCFLTGLSMGAWCNTTFVTGDPMAGPYTYASQIKAICTVEGVRPDDNQPYPQLFQNFAKLGGKDMCFEQINDGRDGGTVVNYMNSIVPNSAQFTQTNFSGGGHCCWSNFYGGGGTQPGVFTIFGVNQNLYQWFASLVIPAVVIPKPVISSPTTATGQVAVTFSYQIAATNTPTSYGATNLPAGLSINTTTGLITGTPTFAGTYSITLSAVNSGGTGTQILSLAVSKAAATVTGVITTTIYSDGTYKTTQQ